MFGSDFPVLTPDTWLADLEKTNIKPELYPKIQKDNAARLLRLRESPLVAALGRIGWRLLLMRVNASAG